MGKINCCYKITNILTNKIYIGITSNFKNRMANHKYKANIKLNPDIEKYGWDNFKKEILFYGSESYCYYMEPLLIKDYNAEYNIAKGGKCGSSSLGENNGNHKLTDKQVKSIRDEYHINKTPMIMLGNKYGVGDAHISAIISGNFRKEAGGFIDKACKREKITAEDAFDIRIRYYCRRGNYLAISKLYSIGKENIGKIVRGERWVNAGGPIKGVDY